METTLLIVLVALTVVALILLIVRRVCCKLVRKLARHRISPVGMSINRRLFQSANSVAVNAECSLQCVAPQCASPHPSRDESSRRFWSERAAAPQGKKALTGAVVFRFGAHAGIYQQRGSRSPQCDVGYAGSPGEGAGGRPSGSHNQKNAGASCGTSGQAPSATPGGLIERKIRAEQQQPENNQAALTPTLDIPRPRR